MKSIPLSPVVDGFLAEIDSTRRTPDGAFRIAGGDLFTEVAWRDGAWVIQVEERGQRQTPDLVTDSAEAAEVYLVLTKCLAWRAVAGLPQGPKVAGADPVEGFTVEKQTGAAVLRWSDGEGEHYGRVYDEREAWQLAWGMRLGVEALITGFRDPAGGGLLRLD